MSCVRREHNKRFQLFHILFQGGNGKEWSSMSKRTGLAAGV